MEAIILAGGLGTRLSSRLNDVPKSMAPVAGRPFLTVLLDHLISSGCESVILSVGHLREVIIDNLKNSYRGIPIRYVIEQTPLGTGGAIRAALGHALDQSVLVLNGDTYLDADFSMMLSQHSAASRLMTMAVVKVGDTARYGGVQIEDHRVSGLVEKGRQGPGWINAGVYVLDRNFPWPADLPSCFSFETEVLSRFLDVIQPVAFLCETYFLDIGVPEDLDRAQIELARQTKPYPDSRSHNRITRS
jgi:D-glycero-alpha-D-manno-heptose 1-phosphate guanylyltransferase